MKTVICIVCQDRFGFIEEPPNAFIGYLLDSKTGKAVEPEVILCEHCYRKSVINSDCLLDIRPNIYSYPMRWRAKHVPLGAKIPLNGQSRSRLYKREIPESPWEQFQELASWYQSHFESIPGSVIRMVNRYPSFWLFDLIDVLKKARERNKPMYDYEWDYLIDRWSKEGNPEDDEKIIDDAPREFTVEDFLPDRNG